MGILEDNFTYNNLLSSILKSYINQYKEYIDSNIKDVNLSDIDVELESDEIDENVEDNLDSEE